MEYVNYLQNILADLKKRMLIVRKEIAECPEGTLYQQTRGGKAYLINSYYKNGERIIKGVTYDEEKVVGLIRRRLLEKELLCLENNSKEMEICIDKCKLFMRNYEIGNLRDKCPAITEEMIQAALNPNSSSNWENEPYERSTYLENEKTQITRKGLRVRSKSELLIAETLYDYKQAFRYEEILHIGNKKFAPDFTIKRADGKLYYWEHFGLTNDAKYIDHQIYKLKLYASIGIVPWDNLIITFDNTSGSVDIREIRAIIENRLLRG